MARRDFDVVRSLKDPFDKALRDVTSALQMDPTQLEIVSRQNLPGSFRELELQLAGHKGIGEILLNDPLMKSSSSAAHRCLLDDKKFLKERREPLEATLTPIVKPRWKQNIVDRIKGNLYEGPLAFATNCVKDRKRVKVYLRRRDGIRGTMEGYLVAFDHHLNLVMRDVDETYHRLKSKKVFFRNANPVRSQIVPVPPVLKYDFVGPKGSNHETLRRHPKQIFVTGDNVVLISACCQ